MATVWKIIQYDTRYDPPRVHKTRLGDTEQGFLRSLAAVRRQERSYPFAVYQCEVRHWQAVNADKF